MYVIQLLSPMTFAAVELTPRCLAVYSDVIVCIMRVVFTVRDFIYHGCCVHSELAITLWMSPPG